MLKFMLDTNTCIFTIKNKPEHIRERFNLNTSRMCISSITLMELIYGAEKSLAPERNLAVVEGFISRLEVLDYDTQAAIHTGQIRAELARKGTPVGPYDQMIAGHAGKTISANLNAFRVSESKTGANFCIRCYPRIQTLFRI